MAMTPAGGTTNYASTTDLFNRYDIREIADYLSDNNSRLGAVPIPSQPDPAVVAADTKLLALGKEASGVFETAVMRSQKYQLVDIQAMLTQNGNGAEVIRGVVCGWWMYLIWQRRPTRLANKELPLASQNALEMMRSLSAGEQILPFQETALAGLPELDIETPDDAFDRFTTTKIARRFFGHRGDTYPQER